ncbi:uncharacterized protein LOC136031006 [Artemia franciscana]|uniref:THAP-type domain-containing protein n=1 Tax=Artemia franciscana TaxID=6661 RepID=A0AA88HCK4_ARTSF|nr:hypothetical protein QYM36_016828 [Artemia franciscana]
MSNLQTITMANRSKIAAERYLTDISSRCCIPGCPTGNRNGSTYYELFDFPSNPARKNAWITRIKSIYLDWRYLPSSKVCGLHFHEQKPSAFPEHNDFCPTIFPVPVADERDIPSHTEGNLILNESQENCNLCQCCRGKDARIRELNSAASRYIEANRQLSTENSQMVCELGMLRERIKTFEGAITKPCKTEHVLNVNIKMLKKQLMEERMKVAELEQKFALKLVELGELQKEFAKCKQKEAKDLKFDERKMYELENEKKNSIQLKLEIQNLKENKKVLKAEVSSLRETITIQADKIKNLEKEYGCFSVRLMRQSQPNLRKKKVGEVSSGGVKGLMKRGIVLEKIGKPTQQLRKRKIKCNDDADDDLMDDVVLSEIVKSKIKRDPSDDESEDNSHGKDNFFTEHVDLSFDDN